MIKYDKGTITYQCRKDTWFTPWIKHAAEVYGFLLNTPERRGKEWSWLEFADFIRGYSSHPTVQLIALHVERG